MQPYKYIYIYIYINASLTCQHECISQLYLHISLTLGSEAIHTDSIPAFQEWSQQTSCRPTLLSSCGNTIVVELIVLRLPRIGLNACYARWSTRESPLYKYYFPKPCQATESALFETNIASMVFGILYSYFQLQSRPNSCLSGFASPTPLDRFKRLMGWLRSNFQLPVHDKGFPLTDFFEIEYIWKNHIGLHSTTLVYNLQFISRVFNPTIGLRQFVRRPHQPRRRDILFRRWSWQDDTVHLSLRRCFPRLEKVEQNVNIT